MAEKERPIIDPDNELSDELRGEVANSIWTGQPVHDTFTVGDPPRQWVIAGCDVPEAAYRRHIEMAAAVAVGGECGLCGGRLVRNPHPDAGKTEVLTSVGYVWVCPPCINKAMSGWYRRYHEAERKAARYREALVAVNRYDDGLRASNWPGLANVVAEALTEPGEGAA